MASEAIPFQEAIDFLAGKVNLPTRRYDDLKHAGHVRGFSVAGVTRDEMLADFRAAIEKARSQGTGFKEFQKDFNAIVDRTGWRFNARGSTDQERRAWRARIIYTTNMRTSYMAGRYKQLTDPDVLKYRPYWQYVHSGALHPRKQHLAWDGLVLAATDPAWDVMYPPNGWGCGCDVEALSRRDMQALGKDAPDEAPALIEYDGIDPRTGQPEPRIGGIDRGWEYNVGKEWLDGVVPTELRQPLPPPAPQSPTAAPIDLPPLPEPTRVTTAALLPDDLTDDAYISAFMGEFDLAADEEGFFRDVSGGIVSIARGMFEKRKAGGRVVGIKANKRGRGVYMRLIAGAVKDPDEIWVDWSPVKSGFVLRRSYLKRIRLPDGRALFVRFEWSSKGWIPITGFEADVPDYLQDYRRGALLYRRT